MKTKLFISTVILFFLLSATLIASTNSKAAATTILQVPSTQYPTIQSALNAANDSDIISVAAGTYNENICKDPVLTPIKTGITLQGTKDTVINGTISLLGFKQLKLDSFTIMGNLTIGDCYTGLVSDSVISNLQVSSTTTIGGPNNYLYNNNFNQLILSGGKTNWFQPSSKTIVENNSIINGLVIKSGSTSNIIKGNIISMATVGILEEASQTYSPTGDNQIINNTITNNIVGISLYCSPGDNGAPSHSADNIIQNIIKNNQIGLELSASNQFVYGNTIYHNDFIDNTNQVTIQNPVTNIWDSGQNAPQTGNY